jgi:putative hemolysin
MGAAASALPVRRGDRLCVELAVDERGVREAQALRYRVFAEQLGARLKPSDAPVDVDEFDPYCQHLLVRETKTDRVVGCTRILTDEKARRLGRYYSDGEFELSAVRELPGRKLEVGRTCIAAEYRQGAGIAVLWSGLAGFIQLHGFDYLFGCASVPLGDQDMHAAAIMNRLRRQAMASPEIRVIPRVSLLNSLASEEAVDAPLPALLKAYVRLGAKACGEACRDPEFGVADVLMLLNVDDLNPAYSRHFLDRALTY